jgi:hypothetical protein
MANNTFYKRVYGDKEIGDEVKFAINITAPGFSMDDDDFEIEVSTPKASVRASKREPTVDLLIFREPELGSDSDSSDSSSSDSSSPGETQPGTWYAIVDMSKLSPGEVRVIATAHVYDPQANDGIRNMIAVTTLGTLKKL